MWAVWLPDVFDNLDEQFKGKESYSELGNFSIDLNRIGNSIIRKPQTGAVLQKSWFKKHLQSSCVTMFEPAMYDFAGKKELATSTMRPIKAEDGTPLGLTGLDISLSQLSEMLGAIEILNNEKIYLYTSSGLVVASNASNDALIGKPSPLFETEEVKQYMTASKEKLKQTFFSIYNKDRRIQELHILTPFQIRDTDLFYLLDSVVDESVAYHSVVPTLAKTIVPLIAVIFIVIAIVIFVIVPLTRSIRQVAAELRNIAQGEGDLTVRLAINGNDEIAQLSRYFNETIIKIGASITSVGINSNTMQEISNELTTNMSETADAVYEISTNIDNVKHQALAQAASVTETAATIEEILKIVKRLNSSIDMQADSVSQSSASVEQMVANIASITQTLDKTDAVIKSLTTATGDGKATLVTSNNVTQKIAEESGSLMEASSVIQHIASQTNLLAMNAAIEAAVGM